MISTLMRRLGLLSWLLPASAALAAPHDLSSFRELQWETYQHRNPEFTLQYPYRWEIGKNERPGEVFAAFQGTRAPGLSVSVLERPKDVTLEQSAVAAAKRLTATIEIESQRSVDLGGTPARAAVVRWKFPAGGGIGLRTQVVSTFVGDHWVSVFATDGVVGDGLSKELQQAALSLRFPRESKP